MYKRQEGYASLLFDHFVIGIADGSLLFVCVIFVIVIVAIIIIIIVVVAIIISIAVIVVISSAGIPCYLPSVLFLYFC